MRVLVLAYGDGEAASTAYRYRASAGLWREWGHEMVIVPIQGWKEDFWGDLKGYDAIINQKALLSVRFVRRLEEAGRPVYFDFDDAIWTRPRKPYSWWTQRRVNRRIRQWFGVARSVYAANEYLAKFARRHHAKVEVVPMALDLDVWRPVPRPAVGEVRVGWAGSPGNLRHLERLREPLRRLVEGAGVRLAVFCGQRPSFEFPFEYVPYEAGRERDFVAGLDVGLLPLEEEEYSLGKSPIKALQYMSCGVAVVGNARGASGEILRRDNGLIVDAEADWHPVLERLCGEPERVRALGGAGRRFVEEHHDLRKVSRRLLGLLEGKA